VGSLGLFKQHYDVATKKEHGVATTANRLKEARTQSGDVDPAGKQSLPPLKRSRSASEERQEVHDQGAWPPTAGPVSSATMTPNGTVGGRLPSLQSPATSLSGKAAAKSPSPRPPSSRKEPASISLQWRRHLRRARNQHMLDAAFAGTGENARPKVPSHSMRGQAGKTYSGARASRTRRPQKGAPFQVPDSASRLHQKTPPTSRR
jgi:hypothetical protein